MRTRHWLLAVQKRARSNDCWLRCHCCHQKGKRPLVVPCLTNRGTGYWRGLPERQPPHDPICVFGRFNPKVRDKARWHANRRPVEPPTSDFAVLSERVKERRVSRPGERSGETAHEGITPRLPALRQRLLAIMVRAELHRLPQAYLLGKSWDWKSDIRKATEPLRILPHARTCHPCGSIISVCGRGYGCTPESGKRREPGQRERYHRDIFAGMWIM